MKAQRIMVERDFFVWLALVVGALALAIGGVQGLLGNFVHTVSALAVSVACAAIVMMLDRVDRCS